MGRLIGFGVGVVFLGVGCGDGLAVAEAGGWLGERLGLAAAEGVEGDAEGCAGSVSLEQAVGPSPASAATATAATVIRTRGPALAAMGFSIRTRSSSPLCSAKAILGSGAASGCRAFRSWGKSYALAVARYFDIHPRDPQPRTVGQIVALLNDDGLIAYPTDSGYALGCRLHSPHGAERIRRIRGLDERHHFTLVCADLGQAGQYVRLDNSVFRAMKAATPGPYTFIVPATREVPRLMSHPKKRTVGVRIPDSPLVRALVRELGEPLLSSTLILPGGEDPMIEGWVVKEELDHVVDAVVDSGECGIEPTTVVDWSQGYPEVVRVGAGDPDRFA